MDEKEFIYIVQASLETAKCKIGKTNNLERRLKEYNNITGKSNDNIYHYLFSCEVKNMLAVENDIKHNFSNLREEKNREIYFYNSTLFNDYVDYIKGHKMFKKEIFIKIENKEPEVKIIEKTTPSLKDRGLSPKDLLQKAKKVNNDEFYTRIEDIEKELENYDKRNWKNKVVFCNCDDAVDSEDDRNSSAFSLYFIKNFKKLDLKKLICTHYGEAHDLFNQGTKGYVFTKDGYKVITEYPNGFTGSFDHPLSLKILNEEADIVCTNPPFSRAIDFWNIIIRSGKKFLIISNITNAINTAYISYFKDKKVWAGYNRIDYYLNPKKQLVEASGHWYTNLPIKNRPKSKHLKIIPLQEIPEKHKQYDDKRTLIVDNCYIPNDYVKPFAISARPILNGILEEGYKIVQLTQYIPYINKERKFSRVLIQKE
ncbi:MAG: adenine-specific methyltransferase EcoRI family protein [Phycisphaerales bacterium]|nr:adenine-specific methyltransferase EcoRI family protein [Phycisphaerales bacterium]